MTKIDKKITGYAVAKPEAEVASPAVTSPEVRLSPSWVRPEVLCGSTFKIAKSPNSPLHAVYVTINHTTLPGGSVPVPVEIFINSKDVAHQQWTQALTLTLSAVCRNGGDLGFIAEELVKVSAPKEGFFLRGVWQPSLVAQVGLVIKNHLESLAAKPAGEPAPGEASGDYPPNATLCPKCNHKAVIVTDGCSVCLNCQDSKCG